MKTKILLIVCLVTSITGCTTRPRDIQNLVVQQEFQLPVLTAFYGDIAWISDNKIGLKYFLQVPEHGMPDDLLNVYDLNTKQLTLITMPTTDATCESDWTTPEWNPSIVSRADDGNLIIIAECSADAMGGPILLLKYEVLTGKLQTLFDYHKERVGLLHFAFTSENELIQEKPVGHPMNNELYKISLIDGSITRILSNFLRARWPTWSKQNQLVAFWGTAQFPGKEPEDLYTFKDIETLVRAPWDLYVMDKNGNNPNIVFPLISNVGGLAWSPNGSWLAFGGTVKDVDGIWLLNINDPNPIRIFNHNEIFDWSPDGKKLIVVENKEFDAKNNDIPVKAYILELPDCVFENSCS